MVQIILKNNKLIFEIQKKGKYHLLANEYERANELYWKMEYYCYYFVFKEKLIIYYEISN